MPLFLDCGDPALLEFATSLLDIYRESIGQSLSALEDYVAPLQGTVGDLKIYKGLRKVLEDKCDVTAPGEFDYAECRSQVFKASAAQFHVKDWETPDEYRKAVLGSVPDNMLNKCGTLYPDLPENSRLMACPQITPEQLLQRYNIALVQGLLLQTEELKITIASKDAAHIRRLFQYMTFFRLLAEATEERAPASRICKAFSVYGKDDETASVQMKIAGPGSVLGNNRRYGLQLASFFPAVCTMDKWRLDALLDLGGKKLLLSLNEKSGLVCPYHVFSACTPQEFALFCSHFKETVSQWQISEELPLIKLDGRDIIVPDFVFKDARGLVIYLELFHCWHAKQLKARLEWLEKHAEVPFILGVDRSLLKDEDIAAQVEKLGNSVFPFRDYPTVDRTVKCLENTARRLCQ